MDNRGDFQAPAPAPEVPHWLNPESKHPERLFAEWLNERRMSDVSSVFHDIMGKYREALAFQGPAVRADVERNAARYLWLRNEANFAKRVAPQVCMLDCLTAKADALHGDAVDAAIDEAMGHPPVQGTGGQ